MRGLLKLLAVATVAAAFAAPAAGAGFLGGGGDGGPPGSAGAGPLWIPPGGDGGRGPHGPSGRNHGPGGVMPPPAQGGPGAGFTPPNPRRPSLDFRQPRRDVAPNFAGRRHDGDDWRRRPRHYWVGDGPIFVPDPSGDYVYGEDDYDDGSDPTGCWVFRKAFDSAGVFLGFVHVDLCQDQ